MDELSHFEKRLAPDETVYRQGETSREMYYIRKGKVEISTMNWGVEKILAVLGTGEFFGETALTDSSPRIYTATAIEETELLIIDKDSFEANLAANPVLKYILETLIQRLRDVTALVSSKDEVKI